MPNAHTGISNIELTDAERAELVSMAKSRSLPASVGSARAYRAGV